MSTQHFLVLQDASTFAFSKIVVKHMAQAGTGHQDELNMKGKAVCLNMHAMHADLRCHEQVAGGEAEALPYRQQRGRSRGAGQRSH